MLLLWGLFIIRMFHQSVLFLYIVIVGQWNRRTWESWKRQEYFFTSCGLISHKIEIIDHKSRYWKRPWHLIFKFAKLYVRLFPSDKCSRSFIIKSWFNKKCRRWSTGRISSYIQVVLNGIFFALIIWVEINEGDLGNISFSCKEVLKTEIVSYLRTKSV